MQYSKLGGSLALLGFLLQLVAADEHAEGCKLAGTYVFDSDPKDPKVANLLTVIGYSKAEIQMIQALAPESRKEISYKDGKMTIQIITKVRTQTLSFENGKEFSEKPLIGVPVKTTPTIEKSKLTLERKTDSGLQIKEVLTCAEDGCTSAYSVKDATAEVKWKRVQNAEATATN